MAAFFTVQDLVDALGEETYMAIFDDFGSASRVAVDASTPVLLVVKRAHAFTLSFMPGPFGSALPADSGAPSNMSELVRHAALEVASCYAYRRRPEYAKTYGAFPGGPMWQGALEMLQRIQAGEQQIPVADNAPVYPARTQGGAISEDGPKASVPSNADNTALGDW